jgi:hypothetical protein
VVKKKVKVGEVYGKWEVLEPLAKRSSCRCQCGRTKLVSNSDLTFGKSTQCQGCSNKRLKPWCVKWPQSHRLVSIRNRVNLAIRRCTDPDNPQYKHYGGRGIKVHQPWIDDPPAFAVYLMTLPGWDDPKLVVDRANNDGDYEPGNLRFVTRRMSNINRRRWGTSKSTMRRRKREDRCTSSS